MSEQHDEQALEGVRLPLEWSVPDDLVSRYATNMVVQHTKQEFTVSFFEVRMPIALGTPEEIKAALQRLAGVKAQCVARVIVAPEHMAEFIAVLQDNLKTYRASFGEVKSNE